MRKDKTLKKIAKLSPHERARLASEKCGRLIQHAIDLIQTNANNEVIYFSPLLADQIPRSRGAHAFNNFQHSMFMHEIVRLCAMWDSEDFEKDNIPTVLALLDDPKTIRLLYQRQLRRVFWERGEVRIYDEEELDEDVDEEMRRIVRGHELKLTKKNFLKNIRICSSLGRGVVRSSRLKGLAEFRHSYVAHNIDHDLKSKVTGGEPIRFPQTGHPKKLLRTTCKVINAINFLARNAGFNFDQSFKIAHRNASRLWGACKFDGVS